MGVHDFADKIDCFLFSGVVVYIGSDESSSMIDVMEMNDFESRFVYLFDGRWRTNNLIYPGRPNAK
jgi:hypothetical protein